MFQLEAGEKKQEISDNSERQFANNLLSAAKDLEKLIRCREFRNEFEQEKQNFPLLKSDQPPLKSEECLKMEVYDDKDYDIEEIKFWNFISKNKGVKPSIIRTIVYKVPESSYIVKKCPIIINEPETQPKKENLPKQAIKTEDKTQLQPTKANTIQNSANNSKKSEKSLNKQPTKITTIMPNTALKTEKLNPSIKQELQPKLKPSEKVEEVKYSSEDVILIDEDDDIIGYDEENDIDVEEGIEDEVEDDDIIEEDIIDFESSKDIEKNKSSKRFTSLTSQADGEELMDDYDDEDEENDEFNSKKVPRNKKQQKNKGLGTSRPKVVIEKAIEPISSISVKKAGGNSNPKIVARSKVGPGMNKSSLSDKAAARKAILSKNANKKKLDQSIDSIVSVSSSSSTMSTISTSILNNQPNDQLRVTRSKAKLIESSNNNK